MDKYGVCDVHNFDFKKLHLTPVTENQFKSRSTKLLYMDPNARDGGVTRIRLGKMKNCFDITPFVDAKDPERKSYYINLQFSRLGESDPDTGDTFKFFKAYDNYIKETAKEHCKVSSIHVSSFFRLVLIKKSPARIV